LEQIEAEKAAAIEAARGQRQQPKKGASKAKRAPAAKPLEISAAPGAADADGIIDAEIVEPTAADLKSPNPPAPKPRRGSGKTKK